MEYKRFFGIEAVGENGYALESGSFGSYPKHCHVFYEMLLYRPFDGFITVNETEFRVDKPTAVLITPGAFHSISVESGCVHYKKIMFSDGAVATDVRHFLTDSLCYPDADLLFQMLAERAFTLQNESLITSLLPAMLVEMAEKGIPVHSEIPKRNVRLVSDAIGIIHSDFAGELSLKTVAERLNVSKQYLSGLFADMTNKTFTAYLNAVRLRFAAALLCRSDLSVSEICYKCGYNNFSYFLRCFKRRYGVSPRTFKQAYKRTAESH